jgi:hypothetical protein
LGKAAASTALPQPPNTSQKVPKNSAKNFFINRSFVLGLDADARSTERVRMEYKEE